jgi:hypothetical protein
VALPQRASEQVHLVEPVEGSLDHDLIAVVGLEHPTLGVAAVDAADDRGVDGADQVTALGVDHSLEQSLRDGDGDELREDDAQLRGRLRADSPISLQTRRALEVADRLGRLGAEDSVLVERWRGGGSPHIVEAPLDRPDNDPTLPALDGVIGARRDHGATAVWP